MTILIFVFFNFLKIFIKEMKTGDIPKRLKGLVSKTNRQKIVRGFKSLYLLHVYLISFLLIFKLVILFFKLNKKEINIY